MAHNHAINILNCIARPNKPIDKADLQRLAFHGVPDEVKGLRPIVWRILLNYLPLDATKWEDTLRQSHDIYNAYKDELITKPSLKFNKLEEQKNQSLAAAATDTDGGIRVVVNKSDDHPLSRQQDSTWRQYYDDKKLWAEIEKDVKRTRNELAFFMHAIDPNRNSEQDVNRLVMQ